MLRVLVPVLLGLVFSAPAQAATTVAHEGAFTLDARQAGGRLCLTLRRWGHFQGARCGQIPRSAHRALSVSPPFGNTYGAAVPRAARTAEAEAPDGTRHRHRTIAVGDFAARFVLLPARPPAKFVRFYGRSGRLLGIGPGPAGYIDVGEETPVTEGVTASTESWLDPTPTDPDRLRTLTCANLEWDRGGNAVCDDAAPDALALLDGCDGPTLAGGVLGPGVAGIRFTLGSGAQLTLTHGHSVFGGTLPVGEAVRSAEAVDGAGHVVAHVAVGTPPGGQPCLDVEQADDAFSAPLVLAAIGAPAAVASADGVPLLVAEQGERLCVGLSRLPAGICRRAPVDSDHPRLLRRGNTVAGVLSGDAARIRLRLDHGAPVTVGTIAGAAYTGRWAGHVRFFTGTVPAGREVVGAVVRNHRGHVIGVSDTGVPRRPVHRRVLAEQGGVGIALVRREGAPDCVVPFAADLPPARRYCTVRDPGVPIDGPVLRYSATVTIPCSPRTGMAYGRIPDDLAPPRLVVAGTTITPRRIRLRDEDAWVAFLPDARVTALGMGGHRAPVDLPPASAQCGYAIDRSF